MLKKIMLNFLFGVGLVFLLIALIGIFSLDEEGALGAAVIFIIMGLPLSIYSYKKLFSKKLKNEKNNFRGTETPSVEQSEIVETLDKDTERLFNLSDELFYKGEIDQTPSLIALPAGVCEILLNTLGKPVKKNRKCEFINKKTNCAIIQVGILGINVCGDILITMQNMGYNLNDEENWIRAKKTEREKILAEYKSLSATNADIFDYSKCDRVSIANEIESRKIQKEKESQQKKKNQIIKAKLKSIVNIDYDKFEDKKTICSVKSLRIDMHDSSAMFSSMMSKRGGVLDSITAGVQYVDLNLRYVETNEKSIFMIDLHYHGNDWIFFRDGNFVIRADSQNYKYHPIQQSTEVKSGGKVEEKESYIVPLIDFKTIVSKSNIEGQISGKSVKVPFNFSDKQILNFKEFYDVVFDGIDALYDSNKFDLSTTKGIKIGEAENIADGEGESDYINEIEQLSSLLKKGIIDEDEFKLKKKQILGL
jgi:hypothetical protein